MANSVPTLTNENFHMFEPSPLETSLASRVGDPANPQMFPLMMDARFRNEAAGQSYQQQIQAMHALQVQEAMAAQATARGGMISTSLKDAGGNPGMTDVLKQLGVIPQGVDTSAFDAATGAGASAKNMGEAGRGIGSAAMGGITGLAPASQSVFGPGAGQGPAAIVQAAQVKEAGANARHASGAGGVTVSMPVGEPGPNQPSVRYKVAPSMVPGLPYMGGRPQPSGSSGDEGNVGDTGPIGASGAPVVATPAPAPAPAKTAAQVQQSVMAALPSIAANSPAIHADIVAGALNGAPNIVANPHGPGYMIQGAKGQYSAAGLA